MGSDVVVLREGQAGWPSWASRSALPGGPALWVDGDAGLLEAPGVCVVGSRRADERACEVARMAGAMVARAGATLVCGATPGVADAAAAGALEAGGKVGVWSGAGVDRDWPAASKDVFREARAPGFVATPFAPGEAPLAWHFAARNALMAAQAAATLAIAVGLPSGVLRTAGAAASAGREVWAVPGPFGDAGWAGSNQMIAYDLAKVVANESALADAIGRAAGGPAWERRRGEALCDEELVLLALGSGPKSPVEVTAETGLGRARALRALAALDGERRVTRLPDGTYTSREAAPGREPVRGR